MVAILVLKLLEFCLEIPIGLPVSEMHGQLHFDFGDASFADVSEHGLRRVIPVGEKKWLDNVCSDNFLPVGLHAWLWIAIGISGVDSPGALLVVVAHSIHRHAGLRVSDWLNTLRGWR